MRLNIQTDYALRLLMHLAVRPNELKSISVVSDYYSISKNHLVKIAQALSRLDVIKTVRGRSGGVKLIIPPEEINVGDIVRHMENDLVLVECFQGSNNNCQISPICRLKNILNDALAAFLKVLDNYTVADLIESKELVSELLQEVS